MRIAQALLVALAPAVVAAGCGSSGNKQQVAPATTTAAAPSTSATTTTAQSTPSALQAEAKSAAAGDIPDNQVFLVFANHGGGYSVKYPEGWAQAGSGRSVTFRDKNNIVRIVVAAGSTPTSASVHRDVASLRGAKVRSAPQPVSLPSGRALKVTYTTVSAPDPVTGKRVTLTVDRYYVGHGGKLAIVDLGSPVGVDNVDAYRLIIQSFRWR